MKKAVGNPLHPKAKPLPFRFLWQSAFSKAMCLDIQPYGRCGKRAAPAGAAVADGKMEIRALHETRLSIGAFLKLPAFRFRRVFPADPAAPDQVQGSGFSQKGMRKPFPFGGRLPVPSLRQKIFLQIYIDVFFFCHRPAVSVLLTGSFSVFGIIIHQKRQARQSVPAALRGFITVHYAPFAKPRCE